MIEITKLKQDVKTGKLNRAYLFHGDERYLLNYYVKQIIATVTGHDEGEPSGTDMMNVDIFSGKAEVDKIIDAAMTLPFLNARRLVIVKSSGLFAAGRKDDTEKLSSLITEIPETTVIVFAEENIDKRIKLYKRFSEIGHIVEFKTQGEVQLTEWIVNYCRKRGKVIDKGNSLCLVREVSADMNTLIVEMDKLIAYKAEQSLITKADIDEVCAKSFETRVFSLVNAVAQKRPDTALEIYTNLILMKEQPVMILALLARQFRLMLQCRLLSRTMSSGAIAKELSLRDFMVKDYLRQGSNFSEETLIKAAEDCLATDIGIKSGLMNARISVEMLIVKYSGGAIA